MNWPKNNQSKSQAKFANRGMGLEEDLELTNQYYRNNNIAIIYKKPTPITVKKVTYPNKNYTKIIDGYFTKPSTTDYNGIYKGCYIDFEAKETNSKTSLPLSAIHQHQIEHLKRINQHGGIAFLIIRFKSYDETYLLEINLLIELSEVLGKKSISRNYLKDKGFLIKNTFNPRIDYLSIINTHYLRR